jgi:RNA polymerase sigma-70 factor (ECF subfamily)
MLRRAERCDQHHARTAASVIMSGMSRSETELVEAAHAGDPGAADELLAMHEQKLYRFGLRMCGNEEDAREVLQETMLAAFRGFPGFRGEARLSTWLYQIARGYCLKLRRRSVGEPMALQPLETASGVAAEADPADMRTHAREIGEALHAAILALPDSLREAVVLRDVEELEGDEAAKVLGIELAALKSRLHRGRAELRKHLAVLLDPSGAVATPCAELAREMREFSSADIDRATCAGIERHLAACPRCAESCVQLGQTASLCCSMPGEEVPRAVRASVRQALLSALRDESAAER